MLIWLRSDGWGRGGGGWVDSGDSLDHVVIYPDLSLLVTRQEKYSVYEGLGYQRGLFQRGKRAMCGWQRKGGVGGLRAV